MDKYLFRCNIFLRLDNGIEVCYDIVIDELPPE